MKFSLKKLGEDNVYLYESDTESNIQLIFVSGCLNPSIWKYQLKYFSRNFKSVAYTPKKDRKDFQSQKKILNNLLDSERFENVVLVSNFLSNKLSQEMENRENVIAQVFTSTPKRFHLIPRRFYNILWKYGIKNPKICKKLLFDKNSDYRVVKEFSDLMNKPGFDEFKSFIIGSKLRRPLKKSLFIYPKSDRFSSSHKLKELKINSDVAFIENAGSFCFFERPEDYNKVLHDFLSRLENFAEKRNILKKKRKNKSLEDFEKDVLKVSQ